MMKFNEMKPEMGNVTIYGYVLSVADTTTSTGKHKVELKMFDGDTETTFGNFNLTAEKLKVSGVEPGTVAEVVASKKDAYYNFSAAKANTNPEIHLDMFKKVADIDRDAAFEELIGLIRKSRAEAKNPKGYADVAENILVHFSEQFKYSSAAKACHHNYIGGLIQHSLTMAKMAVQVCNIYTDLDQELLVSAAALHDVGKLQELDTDDMGNTSYTFAGQMLGHLWLGSELVRRIWILMKKPQDEHMYMFLHMIASHHGKPEWDAIKAPAFKEAYALHMIDMLDSHLMEYENEYKRMEPGTFSEQKPFWADTRIYHPTEQ